MEVLLAASSIDVNAADEFGCTALMYAVIAGDTATVRTLLQTPGINLDARNNDHRTAAQEAEIRINNHYPVYRNIYNLIMDAIRDRRAPDAAAAPAAIVSLSAAHQAASKAAPTFDDRLTAIPGFDENHIPPELIDPILLRIINDPIVVASGITYDRASLTQYFASKGNPEQIQCPTTRSVIKKDELKNKTRIREKDLIEKFVSEQETTYKKRQEQAAAASNSSIVSENSPNDTVMSDKEKLRAARLKFFDGKLQASNPAVAIDRRSQP